VLHSFDLNCNYSKLTPLAESYKLGDYFRKVYLRFFIWCHPCMQIFGRACRNILLRLCGLAIRVGSAWWASLKMSKRGHFYVTFRTDADISMTNSWMPETLISIFISIFPYVFI